MFQEPHPTGLTARDMSPNLQAGLQSLAASAMEFHYCTWRTLAALSDEGVQTLKDLTDSNIVTLIVCDNAHDSNLPSKDFRGAHQRGLRKLPTDVKTLYLATAVHSSAEQLIANHCGSLYV